MNIEEEIGIVKDFCNIKILYGRELCLLEEQLITYQGSIKTLLTAYEKEKEENKRLRKCHLQYEEMTGIDLLLPKKGE